jgi:hypothetical protein
MRTNILNVMKMKFTKKTLNHNAKNLNIRRTIMITKRLQKCEQKMIMQLNTKKLIK